MNIIIYIIIGLILYALIHFGCGILNIDEGDHIIIALYCIFWPIAILITIIICILKTLHFLSKYLGKLIRDKIIGN